MEIIPIYENLDPSPALKIVVEVLEAGGVVVFPTDTLYGLAANALNPEAVEKVYRIKQRSLAKPVPIVARNMKWVRELAHVTPKLETVLNAIWPGAITAILRRKSIVPDIVTAAHTTVGIRVPKYQVLDQLLARYGYPLTMTSANIAGKESSQKISDTLAMFRDQEYKPDLVIDIGTLPPSEPSTLIDLTGDHPKILRVGATKPQQLMELLKL